MEVEIFKTSREFNKKFPSKMYICPRCSSLTNNRYYCNKCKLQSNNLYFKGYKYSIIETGITEKIFIPVELCHN